MTSEVGQTRQSGHLPMQKEPEFSTFSSWQAYTLPRIGQTIGGYDNPN